MESPGKRTPMLKRSREKLDDVTDEPFEKEDGMFLSTPEKKRLFMEGDLAEHFTPDSRNSGRMTCENGQVFEIMKEKKRFRRPSFSRPSFGFFSKRSTPDLNKLRKTPVPVNESSKRTRSNSATECAETDPKRRFSFTPFLDRKNNPQRAMTEKHASKKSNKVRTSSENKKMPEFGKVNLGHFHCDSSESRNTNEVPVIKERPKPMLRAPLINIKSVGKSLIPPSLNPRRETLALHKEQDFNIEAFRPRRETLAIQSHTPTIIPFKPRREKFETEKGQPVLESFKPKRDSLLIHKKAQPQFELMKSVKKDIYNDSDGPSTICQSKQSARNTQTENYERTSFNKEQHNHKKPFGREVDSPVKFTSFGKGILDNDEEMSRDTKGGHQLHGRRMSTGSIMRSGLTQMKSWVSECEINPNLLRFLSLEDDLIFMNELDQSGDTEIM